MVDERTVTELFPELAAIEDHSLRAGVVAVWVAAARRGGWQRIDDVPFTLLVAGTKTSLIEHTRRVTAMAQAIATCRADLNRDYLVAGALLHDVGKLLEYERGARGITRSRAGELIRHPVAGYALAVAHGLPEEVGHIIAAHSEEGEKTRRTPEAIVVHHCDFVDFEIAKR